jgi:phosphate:Na+ symporter
MAGVASSMYTRIRHDLPLIRNENERDTMIVSLQAAMKTQEEYADAMKEELTVFFMELSRHELSNKTERGVTLLLRIISDIEELTDQCVGISMLMERSVRKKQIFKTKEMEALDPFIGMVEDFLNLVQKQLGMASDPEAREYAEELEEKIDKQRDKLRKMGRKRIEAGEDVKTELLFIDLVKRIERLGDFCYSISDALTKVQKKE